MSATTDAITSLEAKLEQLHASQEYALERIDDAATDDDARAWERANDYYEQLDDQIDTTTAAIDKLRIEAGLAWWQQGAT